MNATNVAEISEYLYHYTSLDSLISILRSKKIRFNTLYKMDDNEEAITADVGYAGKYCYASAWTDKEKESIELWGLYTKNMSGVRIKMRSYPFEKSTIKKQWFADGEYFDTYLPKEIYDSNYLYFYPTISFLRKVKYTEDENMLIKSYAEKIVNLPNGRTDFNGNFNDIGLYKRECWRFQQEFRYSFFIIPHDKLGCISMDISCSDIGLPFGFYDIPISKEGLESIEITTGPKMSDNDKFILEAIKSRLGYKFNIKNSELKIK